MIQDLSQLPNTTELCVCDDIKIPRYAIILGDTHFGRYSNDLTELEESVNYFKNFFIPFIKMANKNFGSEHVCVIQVGDIYDNKSAVGILTGNYVIDIFSEIAKTNKCFILIGNHDTVYKEIREINNNKALTLIPNIKVITRLTQFETEFGEKICMMPNYDIKEKVEIAVSNCPDTSYLFGHDEIAGFSYEGKLIKEGSSISAEMLKKFKRVIFGHIHKSQDSENISYIGSAYQTRMNEWKNIPRIGFIDFKINKLVFRENTYSPRYKRINLFEFLQMKISEASEFVKNSKVTVLCPKDSMIRIGLHKITSVLDQYKKIEYKPLYDDDIELIQNELKDDMIDSTSFSADLEDHISQYIKETNSLIVQKTMVQLNPELKTKIKNKLHSLYKIIQDDGKIKE